MASMEEGDQCIVAHCTAKSCGFLLIGRLLAWRKGALHVIECHCTAKKVAASYQWWKQKVVSIEEGSLTCHCCHCTQQKRLLLLIDQHGRSRRLSAWRKGGQHVITVITKHKKVPVVVRWLLVVGQYLSIDGPHVKKTMVARNLINNYQDLLPSQC